MVAVAGMAVLGMTAMLAGVHTHPAISLGTGGAPTHRIETLDAGPAMSGEFL
jgi:hypothetical protein